MVTMKILKSREEWLAARKSFVGGSDASCIVAMNPYKTNVDLWEEKTGRIQPANLDGVDVVEYGRKAEAPLRELFKLDFPQYSVLYCENNFWTNDRFPFAHASLDGWLLDGKGRRGILEIKTTNILQSLQKEKWNHRIPDNYYIQVLHYMAVFDAHFAVLKAQLKYDYDGEIFLTTKHYHIERDDVVEDIRYLMKAEEEFAEAIKQDRRPSLFLPSI